MSLGHLLLSQPFLRLPYSQPFVVKYQISFQIQWKKTYIIFKVWESTTQYTLNIILLVYGCYEIIAIQKIVTCYFCKQLFAGETTFNLVVVIVTKIRALFDEEACTTFNIFTICQHNRETFKQEYKSYTLISWTIQVILAMRYKDGCILTT